MKRIILFFVVVVGMSFAGNVKNSKHDLSSGGGGPIKAIGTSLVCIFCHTSHSSFPSSPLWNREEGAVSFNTYNSSTLYSTTGQPTGTSKLCLSCHDGTIALGKVKNRRNEFNMSNTHSGKIPKSSRSNLGTNLTDDHPISFYPADAIRNSIELVQPSGQVRFEQDGQMQCMSCHDPHDDTYQPFLVESMGNANLCKNCHQRTNYNGQSTHDISPLTWSGGGATDPWPHTPFNSVAQNSCLNCHRPHAAAHPERLLSYQKDEDVCLICHDGSLGQNIAGDIKKFSAHSVDYYSGHEPDERMESAPKHVECVDCHNPHQLNGTQASAPWANGTLKGVSGRTTTGVMLDEATEEHQVCLKCHGLSQYFVTPPVIRQDDTSNIGDVFNPSNASYHPVASVGRSNRVPSLVPGYSTNSRIYCTDCHNSSSSVKAGGRGPNGPHGSSEPYLLERRYEIGDNISFSTNKYAMCFKCHDPNRIMDGQGNGFAAHRLHIDEKNTACSVCHDPHGSPNNVALINFDTSVVFPNSEGRLEFIANGSMGSCYLQCHGEDHNPIEYERK